MTSPAPATGPLTGLRVLDLSRVLAGPFCTMMLGDLGADVIKVEQPGTGDDTRRWGPPFAEGESAYYLAINRNKRSVTLDLKRPRVQELLLDLVRQSDVVVENFKRGTLERLGLGYERLRPECPGLIYCSISGYGPDGPYADRPGYDIAAQAMGGLMSVTGERDGQPLKAGVALADLATGMFASTAILAALHHREKTGQGQRVDVSLLESVVALLINVASSYLMTGETPARYGNAHPNLVPYEQFRTIDGTIIVGAGNDRQFRDLCVVAGVPDVADDARFRTNADRVTNREALIPILQDAFEGDKSAAWVARLLAAGVMAAPINTLPDVFADPQVLHRQMLMELDHPTIGSLRVAGIPYKLGTTPASGRRAPPLLGQHTEEVLRELLGLSDDELAGLKRDGAI